MSSLEIILLIILSLSFSFNLVFSAVIHRLVIKNKILTKNIWEAVKLLRQVSELSNVLSNYGIDLDPKRIKQFEEFQKSNQKTYH